MERIIKERENKADSEPDDEVVPTKGSCTEPKTRGNTKTKRAKNKSNELASKKPKKNPKQKKITKVCYLVKFINRTGIS